MLRQVCEVTGKFVKRFGNFAKRSGRFAARPAKFGKVCKNIFE